MPIGYLKDIADHVPRTQSILGIDVGSKTLGLALGDVETGIATPLHTIARVKFSKDLARVQDVINQYDIGAVVMGLPVNMDGSEGRRAQSIRDFAAEFSRQINGLSDDPVIGFWDERLSTETVEGFVDNFVEKRKTRVDAKASGLIDKLAAQVILQGALDFMRQRGL